MRSWSLLDLNKPDPVRRPASSFPDRADEYICDMCGADLTKYLPRPSSHSWPPYGPARYICRCGAAYLTGAVEWESLDSRERRRRLRDLVGLSLMFAAMFAIPGTCLGLLIYWIVGSSKLGLVVGVLIATPASIALLTFELGGILRSIVRTNLAGLTKAVR